MRQKQRVFSLFLLSPSSRRAWIEITAMTSMATPVFIVALLTEGVDRNTEDWYREMPIYSVALLTEGVDRN